MIINVERSFRSEDSFIHSFPGGGGSEVRTILPSSSPMPNLQCRLRCHRCFRRYLRTIRAVVVVAVAVREAPQRLCSSKHRFRKPLIHSRNDRITRPEAHHRGSNNKRRLRILLRVQETTRNNGIQARFRYRRRIRICRERPRFHRSGAAAVVVVIGGVGIVTIGRRAA